MISTEKVEEKAADENQTDAELLQKETNNETGDLKLDNLDIVCSKHGNITGGMFYAHYNYFGKDPANKDKTILYENHNFFCIACLNDMYMHFQEQGLLGKITAHIKPVIVSDDKVAAKAE